MDRSSNEERAQPHERGADARARAGSRVARVAGPRARVPGGSWLADLGGAARTLAFIYRRAWEPAPAAAAAAASQLLHHLGRVWLQPVIF